jgi:hypothetical protein
MKRPDERVVVALNRLRRVPDFEDVIVPWIRASLDDARVQLDNNDELGLSGARLQGQIRTLRELLLRYDGALALLNKLQGEKQGV